ncbi:hypothetical protein [Terrimonas alba]|uniref:hypothetical protein n=1 Tax=Terrimonas alba TaxID=3349636 RepID=UPI0035F23AEC
MTPPYQTIHAFFDCYDFVNTRSLLKRLIKTADSGKIWQGTPPCDVLYFSEKIDELIEAVYTIINTFDHRPEVILDKAVSSNCWSLTAYDSYCGCHLADTPWDFFPRHLSKKEFLDPYKALEKFTRYLNIDRWKKVIKDLLYHALSDIPFDEFDNSQSTLLIYIHLNKLIESAHLIEVRIQPEPHRPRRKWKDRQSVLDKTTAEQNNEK